MVEQTQIQSIRQIFSSGIAFANDREIAYAEKLGAVGLLNISYIIKIEKYDEANIGNLNTGNINHLSAENDNFQDTYEESTIIQYFQLNKGIAKSQEQIDVIEESQIKSKSPLFLFYEQNMQTDEGVFSENLQNKIKNVKKELFVVLEIESKRIKEKVDIALSLGVRNFIFRAGKYEDTHLWNRVISAVHDKSGLVFVALPRRMHDKISYIKDMFEFGVDFVFHEVFNGWGNEILHLNSEYRYVNLSFNRAIEGYSEFEDIRDSLKYGFSRVRAINLANSYAGTIEVLQIP